MNRSKSKKNKNGKNSQTTTTTMTQPPQQPPSLNNNNNNTIKSNSTSKSKNGNKSIINSKNVDKKTKSTSNDKIINEDPEKLLPQPKKLERSNSFVLALRGIFRGSQDELHKTEKKSNNFVPVPIVRSRTQIDLPSRSIYRRSIREPKLEELKEEHDGEVLKPLSEIPIIEVETDSTEAPLKSDSDVILRNQNESSKFIRRSRNSASFRSFINPEYLPDENSKESEGLFGKLKRTLSTKSDRRSSMNSKWSASLQSLQQIDTMVSYEDLTFINYDKFNTYEKQITRLLNNARPPTIINNTTPTIEAINPQIDKLESSITSSRLSITNSLQVREPDPPPKIDLSTVKRRTKSVHFRPKTQFDSTFDKNFDEFKNVYRQSFDGKTLEHFHNVNRDSFRLSMTPGVTETLLLDNYLEKQTDEVDNATTQELNVVNVADIKLIDQDESKSKSLTYLDQLDPNIEIQNDNNLEQSSTGKSFTVFFNLDHEQFCEKKDLTLASTKGVTLEAALSNDLKMRNLSFSQIKIYDNNFQNSTDISTFSGVVDGNTDIGGLAGKVLVVVEKETSFIKRSHSMLKKAASIGYSKTHPKLITSVSTEETHSEQGESTKSSSPSSMKQSKQKWSNILGFKNPQQNQLCELLNGYVKTGVPPTSRQIQLSTLPEYVEAVAFLENVLEMSWDEFIDRSAMSDRDMKIQSAIWELVVTEADYIRALQTVTNLFLACLEGIQSENLLTTVDQNKLFSNIRDICDVNIKFWTIYLYPMVKHSINSHHPMCIEYFQEGFLLFSQFFFPYTKYCAEQSTCQNICKELSSTNILFTAYLAWCESRSECKRLRLVDILVRPMQRLTKYSLLLSAIRKHVSSNETDCEIMDAMIHSVEEFVSSVNTHLTTRQETERLKGLMARIEAYDVVDSGNENLDKMVKQYSTMFDLCEPLKGLITQNRNLFMEGDLKYKDNFSKADVHCFLLTDIFLVCKPISKKSNALKVIRQPYLTDRIVTQMKDNSIYCVYLNEFNTAVSAFTLQNVETKVVKHWHECLTKVKHIYTRLKQGTQLDDLNFKQLNNNDNIFDIKKSPHSSSFGSKGPSSNNSVNGSVELNESKTISMDFEKTNSQSSDEGSTHDIATTNKPTYPIQSIHTYSRKFRNPLTTSLVIQPTNNLGQSLPNLNLNTSQNCISNTLLVPGTSATSVGAVHQHSNNLLSPSHRGISYPPPSPQRATLQRTRAIQSVKNPPLQKTKNVPSQSSFNWAQSLQEPHMHSIFPQSPTTATSNTSSTIINHSNPSSAQSFHNPSADSDV